ncbi:tetratricopeptide repeat protein [Streptomyces sp. 184]|uniref:tetratricopeptide repeat protein n=1 Tax=Streptomyces sp. 184 TaxID=1827526 RepID=UPI0038923AFD
MSTDTTGARGGTGADSGPGSGPGDGTAAAGSGLPVAAAGTASGPGGGAGTTSAPDPGNGPGHGAAGTLRAALLVARVRTAARAGDLDDALRLLRAAETRDARSVAERPDVLDLFARVHAQRGELDAAATYWRRVRTRHPDDPSAAAGLARIARLDGTGPRASLARHRTRTAVVAAVCAVAVVATGAVALVDDEPSGPSRTQPVAASEQQIEQRVREELAAAEQSARAREDSRREAAARDLARTLGSPGLRPQVRGGSVEVAFTEGVFSEGAELTPEGAASLTALGERLTALDARVAIHGHAATVPDAPRSGGSVLALWRALIAARELSASSGRPLTDFTTSSADQREAPYAQDAKNRTVTVVVTPR